MGRGSGRLAGVTAARSRGFSATRGSGSNSHTLLRVAALSMSLTVAAGMLQRQGARAAFAGPALLSLGGRLGQRLPAVSTQFRTLPVAGRIGRIAPLSMSAEAKPAGKQNKKKKVHSSAVAGLLVRVVGYSCVVHALYLQIRVARGVHSSFQHRYEYASKP